MGILWCGGTIYTMAYEGEVVEAVFTENGMIRAIGKEEDLRDQYSELIDKEVGLRDCVMFPGFVDSHMHIIGHGEKMQRFDLSKFHSKEEILQFLKEKSSFFKKGEWIIAEGWDENYWTDKKPFNRLELDGITTNHPVLLRRVCWHAAAVNSLALKIAGITTETPSPAGGVIVKDAEGGPTGILLEQAQELIFSKIPFPSFEYLESALTLAVQDCFRKGLTGAHTEDLAYYGGFEQTYKVFKKVIDGRKTKFRAHLLVHHHVVDEMANSEEKVVTPFLELGAMKIFADGSLGSRSALLSYPYKDDPETSGVAIHSQEELNVLVKKARNYNMAVAVHAIGDLAFEYVLNALENSPPPKHSHDRIIHAQILRDDLIERVRNKPIVLDIQPRFVASDFPWVIERVGENRIRKCYAWKTLLEKGIPCAGGSDAPIEPLDPLLGIHAAVTRKTNAWSDKEYIPEQKLSVYEAVKLFTSGPARAIGKDQQYGLIRAGYAADFTIISADLFRIPHDEIPNVHIMMTVVDGTVMYKREV